MLEVQVERLGVRDAPVAARVEGALPPGVQWNGEWIADPPRMRVHGPRSALAKLDSVRLVPVHMDGARDTVRAVVGPASIPAGCRFDPAAVVVRVPVSHTPR